MFCCVLFSCCVCSQRILQCHLEWNSLFLIVHVLLLGLAGALPASMRDSLSHSLQQVFLLAASGAGDSSLSIPTSNSTFITTSASFSVSPSSSQAQAATRRHLPLDPHLFLPATTPHSVLPLASPLLLLRKTPRNSKQHSRFSHRKVAKLNERK